MMLKVLLSFIFLEINGVRAQYQPTWDSLNSRPLPKWYDQSKFGIFLHWGVYSVPSFGSEWFWHNWKANSSDYVEFMEENYPPDFEYPDFAPMFKAELFNPTAWAELFKKAGAKYVVLTSKHHEGFTNWPSKYSWNWNSYDVGPHMDLAGELATAIRNNTSLHFGLYYSLYEWFHPLFLQDQANKFLTQTYVTDVMQPQLHEIVESYKPEIIWADGDGGASDTYWQSKEFLAWLYNSSPVKDTVVVNDRWGSGDSCKNGGYFTCHDRYNPGTLQKFKWEDCMTVQKGSWGYKRNTDINGYYTAEELISQLVIAVSTGGNMLLNVGPSHDGRIMPIFEEILLQIGQWLETNGECIYNSVPWAHQNDTVSSFAWYTAVGSESGFFSETVICAVLLDWPSNNTVMLGALSSTHVSKVEMLGLDGVQLKFSSVFGGLQVDLPIISPSSDLKRAWTLKITTVTSD